MALRFQHIFWTQNNSRYAVNIYDEEHVGSITEFRTDDTGYIISYDGEGEKMKTPVVTSKCEVNILVENATIEQLVEDLAQAYEGRFRITITSGTTLIKWVGIVLPDLVEIEDLPLEQYPILRLVATDGIKRLQTVSYKDTGGPYEGEDSIIDHLTKIIAFVGTTDLLTYLPYTLKTVTNWFPASIAAGDMLYNTAFDHRALYQIDEKGNIKYPSVYKVLEQLCLVFHARFYMWGGIYWFVQHNAYENANWTAYTYTKLGASWVSGSEANFVDVADSFPGKFGRGSFGFFPAINIAQVNYVHFGYANIAQGYRWNQTTQPTIPEAPTQYFMEDGASFNFNATFYYYILTTGDRPAHMKFRFTFKVDTNYLDRQIGVSGPVVYQLDEEISASLAYYEVAIPVDVSVETSPGTFLGSANIPVSFTTIPFPTGGAVEFTISYVESYDYNGNVVTTGVSALQWAFAPVELTFLQDGGATDYTNTKTVTAQNATAGNSEQEVVNTVIGQSLGYGRLRADTGSGTIDAVDWGRSATVSNQSIEQLLAIEIIRTQSVPIKRRNMFFDADIDDIFLSIKHKTDTWIFRRGKFHGYKEYIEGEWYRLDTTGSTSSANEDDWVLIEPGTDGNPITPSYPIGGTPSVGGSGGGTVINVNSLLDALFPRTTADIANGATVTQIPIETRTVAGEYKAGQTVTLVNQYTGAQQDFTVAADTAISDTNISVTSDTANFFFPEGSWIITSQEEQGATGGSAGFFREEFPAHASATITVTVNSGNLPTNAAAIRVYFNNGQIISQNFWSHSGSDITLTFTPNGSQSIWVEFTA